LSLESTTAPPTDHFTDFHALDTPPAPSRARRVAALFAAVAVAAALGACSGGGNAGESPFPTPTPSPSPPPAADDSAQLCAPTNPYVADATAPTVAGTLANEKAWLHNYMDDAYLWFGEIPTVDAGAAAFSDTSDVYGSLDNYFNAQLTPAQTASGAAKDRFSFIYPTRAWNDLINSGSSAGYGIEWYADAWNAIPRGIRVATVEAGSPAAAAGLQRGDQLVSADGASADTTSDAGIETLNAALFPSGTGQSHQFVFSRSGTNLPAKTLASADVTKDPVPTRSVYDSGGTRYGYIVFTDHIASSESKLIEAVNYLKGQSVQELVLDLRYNGGGYLYLASELAYMIAGPTPTSGKAFERLVYNSKRSTENETTPFYNVSCILNANFDCTSQQALPTLNLSRVSVITSASTCSASEAIVNGLRGVGIDVRLIGGTTCGKPYGFTAKDNCGVSYFPIEFKGENEAGFSDYSDGFAATCPASDDFVHALGDADEGMLNAAIYNLQNDACDLTAAQAARRSLLAAGPHAVPRLLRGPQREARIALPHR